MGVEDARHLLSRTGFTPNADEIHALSGLTRSEAIERLLAGAREAASSPPPESVRRYQRQPPRASMTDEEIKARKREHQEQVRALRGWWFNEMRHTDSPLTERMTLFWHNHFVSGLRKVKHPDMMYRQNALFRREALGSFARLLHAAAKDPAMVVYLDAASSKKEAPNENFAREVMELFTLGEGRYSERDVKEAARSFTGWGIDRDSGDFVMRPRQHDNGNKTVLGKSGNFDGDAVLDILLGQSATAEFITAKLWREFISPEPDKKEVARIARHLHAERDDIRVALRELFNSPAFWDAANRGSLVKSPVELVVGTLRVFGAGDPGVGLVANAPAIAGQMGQALFAPPNVKGWPGGQAWIDSQTLGKRHEFLTRLTAPRGGIDMDGWQAAVASRGLTPQFVLLGATSTSSEGPAALLMDPRYQLK